jgi:alpha-D-ribose 1-methylphosphonate 5-triphosphate synthase subunit PhnG
VMGGSALGSRALRLSVLAKADGKKLVQLWTKLGLDPEFSMLRPPQTGLVGMRGRIGGGGDAFNFGEATVTRATIKLASGAVGHAYALGRDVTKAKLSAIIDALAQDHEMAEQIDRVVIMPLSKEAEDRDALRAAQTAATKVDFFTMVRGED